jgi:hypothetical protein
MCYLSECSNRNLVDKETMVKQGCQIFIGTTYQIYKISIKYTNWPQNIQNGHKIDEMATK